MQKAQSSYLRAQRAQIAHWCSSADLHYQRGEYQKAGFLFGAALEKAEQEGIVHPQELSALLNSLGRVYKYTGRFEDADALYHRALALVEQSLGPDHPEAATLCHNLGGLEHARGRHAA